MKLLPIFVAALVLAGYAASPAVQGASAPTSAPAAPSAFPPSQVGIGRITLGMPLDAAMKILGSPGQVGTDDKGATYHAYPLGNSGGYMVVMPAPFRPNYVFGIQITGGADTPSIPILGLRLGDKSDALLTNIGVPSSKTPVQGMDRTQWNYAGRNYSFEVDSSGQLVSILVYGYRGIMLAQGWGPNWEDYQPNSIAAIIEAERSGWETAPHFISAGDNALRPRVTYTGEVRDTPVDALTVIKFFVDTMKLNVKPEVFSKSIKVVEDGKEYWLPAQQTVIEEMQEALKPGDATDLFAVWMGAMDKGRVKVVAVNEYCSCDWVPLPAKDKGQNLN